MAEPSQLVLGSASPRRAALLRRIGIPHTIQPVTIDETALVTESATALTAVVGVARAKFDAIGGTPGPAHVLTADTLVACGARIMGKPDGPEHLAAMLRAMSGRSLAISTAVCHGPAGATPTMQVVTTLVQLRALTERDIADYVATGAGADKAGGLALQAQAGSFIAGVDGCWSNVLGLPLCAVATALDLDPRGTPRAERCSIGLCGPWR